jgi:hypothetical protein
VRRQRLVGFLRGCTIDIVAGLDLGQQQDFTACSVLRRSLAIGANGLPTLDSRGDRAYRFDAFACKRFDLGTSYTAIAAYLAERFARPEFKPSCLLAVDQSGVGRGILEMIRAAMSGPEYSHVRIWGITATGGFQDPDRPSAMFEYNVPKVVLVSRLREAINTERLTIPPGLPLASLILAEMRNYQVQVSKAAHETYSAREGANDDVVASLALPIWLSTRRHLAMEEPTKPDEDQSLSALPREVESVAKEAELVKAAEWEAVQRSRGIITPKMIELSRLDPFDPSFGWRKA